MASSVLLLALPLAHWWHSAGSPLELLWAARADWTLTPDPRLCHCCSGFTANRTKHTSSFHPTTVTTVVPMAVWEFGCLKRLVCYLTSGPPTDCYTKPSWTFWRWCQRRRKLLKLEAIMDQLSNVLHDVLVKHRSSVSGRAAQEVLLGCGHQTASLCTLCV